MAKGTIDQTTLNTEEYTQSILETIEREREREIISRRFGLFDRKETLEQIGELLGITRERVRQLEKSVVSRLKANAEVGELPQLSEAEAQITAHLKSTGGVGRVVTVSEALTAENSKTDQARVAFLGNLCPDIVTIDETDDYYQAMALKSVGDEKAVKASVNKLVDTIKKIGEPTTIDEIAKAANMSDVASAQSLASVSKKLATLNGRWGLVKWPMVNPKNIRDKIYVILKEHGKHMHFNEIAEAIKDSDFKRKDVTTQAIHNELIKDKRFVLVGRGIYALKEWGYEKGTVADIIADILREEGAALHRDEIVKRVLKSRYVKETTILLNLQGKPQFKRVAKATYALAE
jgi:DNA-binding phage protein